MKAFFAVCALLSCFVFGTAAHAADLSVTLQGLKGTGGTVIVGLFTSEKDFPERKANVMEQNLPVQAGSMALRFEGLAAGTYAVAVFHDKNADGVLNTDFWGIPEEAYGFSRNVDSSFGPPDFSDAALNVTDKDMQITIMMVH